VARLLIDVNNAEELEKAVEDSLRQYGREYNGQAGCGSP